MLSHLALDRDLILLPSARIFPGVFCIKPCLRETRGSWDFLAMRFVYLLLFAFGSAAFGSNWPQFRGPGGDGHADTNKLPTAWSEQEHVKWKTAIQGRA